MTVIALEPFLSVICMPAHITLPDIVANVHASSRSDIVSDTIDFASIALPLSVPTDYQMQDQLFSESVRIRYMPCTL